MAELHPDGAALEQACGFETELLHQLLTHVFLKALGKHWRGPLPRVGWIISHRHQRTKRAIQDALHADAGRGQGLAEDDVVAGRPGCRRTHGALQVGLHYVAQHHEGLDVYAVAVQAAQTIHAVEQAAMADASRIHERHADGQPIAGDRIGQQVDGPWPMFETEWMTPSTVPNSPMNGALLPSVPRIESPRSR